MNLRAVAPSGFVEGFCTHCKADRLVPQSTLACPICGERPEPQSLPAVSQAHHTAVSETRAPTLAAPNTPTVAPQSIALPQIRQAVTWGAATDDLLAALEREEQAALAAFNAVKAQADEKRARVKAARTAIAALRQVRGQITVPGESLGRRGRPKPTGRWSRQFDACRICGRTSIKHAAHGRCVSCDWLWRKHGVKRPVRGRGETTDGDN